MISQTAEYALRAVVYLAEEGGGPCTVTRISAVTKVASDYLSKVMQALGRSGIVFSQRGKNGGFALTRPASELTIYEVVQAVDPIQRITKCPLDLPAHRNALCALHCRLDEATSSIEKSFRETTVADLLSKPIFESPSGEEPA